ncbi:MAG: OadG family transporter subunit [Bacilli bacterium]
MHFLAIYDGTNFNSSNIKETLIIVISSMLLVFLILILLIGVIKLMGYLTHLPSKRPNATALPDIQQKRIIKSFDDLSEDEQAAVLVATIDFKETEHQDAALRSIQEIKEGHNE